MSSQPSEPAECSVVAPDGATIAYRVLPGPSAPSAARSTVVLVHGWAQSAACWGPAVLDELSRSARVIAPDLRGHGRSSAPEAGYDDPETWAGDLDAVLNAEGIGDAGPGVVLVGWSYGGVVCCDFLARLGTARVSGLVLVGAITGLGRGRAGGRVGPAMRGALPDALSEDPAVATAALAGFVGALRGVGGGAGESVDGETAQALLGASLATPPRVRGALFRRETDHDALLGALEIPVLVLHGTADPVVDFSAAQHNAARVADAQTSYWDGAGHAPFLEDPARFVAELTAFVGESAGEAARTAGTPR